ncbi:MAG: hypothetical protein IKJ97_00290 [Bacteroidaceae bacterium]|nr:hypothetical protein [Bacteroidaceae bacterium]
MLATLRNAVVPGHSGAKGNEAKNLNSRTEEILHYVQDDRTVREQLLDLPCWSVAKHLVNMQD